ncbi:heavy-metal-associated domain-containing protein [Roseateles puraquae]|jgi:copper chaperone
MDMVAFEVKDMTCGHCVSMITKAVKFLDGDAQVAIDLASKRVQIESRAADEAELKTAIEEAGYTPTPVAAVAAEPPQKAAGSCCGCSR